ncbi:MULTISPECIES: EAL domain-containing protein [Rhizobium]|uniref:EAL domain-containing protein n=1 Tax=Rhizobium tropici TaxID=398 RepID=A0A329YG15_RHITR|nr:MULTISPECIES: EAL domain-containing protein [Rhizobium]MBB3289794.1 diguanylate cyclase (GGDEF)-like protein [Rhizobium sp. BK252]MBB3404023.1 diguanylate cyclase (GGDEF)-like protein [Rhizobium sp. BK289]MBB3417122.1 diguanylate cyclase (GGDEF)-like protein [Rhizobium sp. BK284]MBB3484999.1 diguanylate cyclase (GGDEF)-like protein [Rhizobium sp. BK347]MDK4722622.1 EAL domain-containing protein [Rhizobium sp. CNPSo 3968]
MKPPSPDTVPTDVYLSFVSSLFGNRKTLFTGVFVHILTYVIVFLSTRANIYLTLCLAFGAVFALRMYSFRQFDAADKHSFTRADIAKWETRYVIGAAATASILGIGSGYAILIVQDPLAEFICIAVTMASMVSIVGRNYGSQKAIDLQTLACCLPIIIACLMSQQLYKAIVSIMLVPFGLTTRAMANGVREFLYKNVIASREISLIADRFDTALNNMTHGLFMLDAQNRILVVNRKACELLNFAHPEQLKDCEFDVVLRYGARNAFIDGSLPGLIHRQMGQLVSGTLSRTLIQFNEDQFLEFSASRRADGIVILIFEDVTVRIRAERKILHMVRYDPLTGLPNREYFIELVKEKLAARMRDGRIGILVLDVDDFKHVNDTKGHLAGDRLLVAIAERLKELAGTAALSARLVGDQFVLFFPNEDNAPEIDGHIRALHAAMTGIYDVDGNSFRISFSGGYVTMPSREFRSEEWQVKVDLALFDAKSRLKGGCSAFEEEMDARYVERQKLKEDLREAVEAGRLHAVYQPMFTPDGSRIVCCEALARWIHPEKGSIPPNIFVQIAEEMGIVAGITRFMINQACRDCVSWPAPLAVSVNLSAQDLRNDDIVTVVMEALEASGLEPSRLHLEVTESCLMDEVATVRSILADLRAKGITIAIDDFGTGFSSLSYLDSLPVDVVKIDRSFVRDITTDSRRFKLLCGIVDLSRALSLHIVIEGVETLEQLALIVEKNLADIIQGYVFSAPVTREQVAVMVAGLNRRLPGAREDHVA